MGVRQDEVQVKLTVAGDEARVQIDNLQRRQQVLTDTVKGTKKGTQEWIDANKELKQVTADLDAARGKVGLVGLSISQLDKLSKELNRDIRSLTPGTEEYIQKSQQLRQVNARLDEVRADVRGVSQELDKGGNSFLDYLKKGAVVGGIALGFEAVVGSAISFGKESVEGFIGADAAARQLEATLTSTGGAVGLTKDELLALSDAAETDLLIDADEVTKAQSLLLTFTQIKGAVYKDALPAILDIATKMGGDGPADLKGATIQVGKALNDPIKGISALTKVGVSFSEEQKKMIKSLQDTGDVAGAQRIILEELGKEFGGSAAAAAAAADGPLKAFGFAMGQVQDEVGELILDGLNALLPVVLTIIQGFGFLIDVLKATPEFLRENKTELGLLAVALLAFNANQIRTTVTTLAANAAERARAIATTVSTAATNAAAVAQRLLNAAMTANPIGLVIAAVALLVAGFIALYNRSETVRAAVAGLAEAAVSLFTSIKGAAIEALSGLGDLLVGIFTLDTAKIKAGLASIGGAIKAATVDAGKNAGQAFAQGYNGKLDEEAQERAAKEKAAAAERVQQARQEATERAAADRTASLEALKERQANIKAALAAVKEGSAEELRLKKLEVATKRDIELLDEKKTAADKKVVRAEAAQAIRKLEEDFTKKRQQEAEKEAKEQADIAKRTADLRAGLIKDETERRIVQLQAAAQQELAQLKGSEEQKAEQRKLIEQKLEQDIAAERKKSADKQLDEEADLQKRRLALEKDEYVRRAGELELTAAEAARKVTGSEQYQAEARKLINQKLVADLAALAEERAAKEKEVAVRVAQIDADITARRRERGRAAARERNPLSAAPDNEEQRDREVALKAELDRTLANDKLSNNERLAAWRQYHADKESIEAEFADRTRQRNQAEQEFALGLAQQGLQVIGDFNKIASDRELQRAEQAKAAKLKKLDEEYKAGRVSKDQYEKQKAAIETNYDAQARNIKKKAAEDDKKLQIAQAIIAGTLAVIKAAPNVPLQIATGILSAAAVAKIIATPIPTFAKGGLVGAGARALLSGLTGGRQAKYATGGTINATAGVPEVGQLHSGGGIKMLDGKTGEYLGEWERGEPYMILSRTTYANNKEVVDKLLDTSMYRGGAKIKWETGGTPFGGTTPGGSGVGGSDATGQAMLEVLRGIRQEVSYQRADLQNLTGRLHVVIGDKQIGDIHAGIKERAAIEAEMQG